MPGRPLNTVELDSYRLIPRALAARVRVHEIRAMPGSFVGITLGRHVFLATEVLDDGESLLLAHELVHVRQWHTQGVVGFGRRYIWAFLRSIPGTRSWNASYLAIPDEVEARTNADRWFHEKRFQEKRFHQHQPGAPTDQKPGRPDTTSPT